jgi:hypothetical protein
MWHRCADPQSGLWYYYNYDTGESRWDAPAEHPTSYAAAEGGAGGYMHRLNDPHPVPQSAPEHNSENPGDALSRKRVHAESNPVADRGADGAGEPTQQPQRLAGI